MSKVMNFLRNPGNRRFVLIMALIAIPGLFRIFDLAPSVYFVEAGTVLPHLSVSEWGIVALFTVVLSVAVYFIFLRIGKYLEKNKA